MKRHPKATLNKRSQTKPCSKHDPMGITFSATVVALKKRTAITIPPAVQKWLDQRVGSDIEVSLRDWDPDEITAVRLCGLPVPKRAGKGKSR